MEQKDIIHGSGVKMTVSLSDLGDGVTLKDCNFTLEYKAGDSSKSFEVAAGEDLPDGVSFVEGDDNTVKVALDTSEVSRGPLFLRVTVLVPDEDFPDGSRKEILDKSLNRNVI